ncbi:MAG: preprotein translocase subunit SecG, partial [Candidatus Adiutrix sp.]
GPATFISKVTCGAAVIFMCTSLNLAISQGGLTKGSVMDNWSETPEFVSQPLATLPVETVPVPSPVAAPLTSDSVLEPPLGLPSELAPEIAPQGAESQAP